MDREKMREAGRKKLEEFRKAKERRAAAMAAATAKAATAQFLDDSATLGGVADAKSPPPCATEHRRPNVACISHSQTKPNVHPASREDNVADLESLDAFGLFTPPRDPIGAAAAQPRGSCAGKASGRERGCENGNGNGNGVDPEKNKFVATTPEQDPFVEMLTRQVRSLQREKAEMGEENAALRREVRSLEELVESLESLLEGGCGDEKTGGGGGGGERQYSYNVGGCKSTGGASSPEGASGEVTAAVGRHSHRQGQGHDHGRGFHTRDRSKQSYVGKWLDTAVALGMTDMERSFSAGRSAQGGGEGEYSYNGGGGVGGGVGGGGGGASFVGGDSKMLDWAGARASSAAGHPRRCLTGAWFAGRGDSPLDHRYGGGGTQGVHFGETVRGGAGVGAGAGVGVSVGAEGGAGGGEGE